MRSRYLNKNQGHERTKARCVIVMMVRNKNLSDLSDTWDGERLLELARGQAFDVFICLKHSLSRVTLCRHCLSLINRSRT